MVQRYITKVLLETEYLREKYNASEVLQVSRCYDRTKEWNGVTTMDCMTM